MPSNPFCLFSKITLNIYKNPQLLILGIFLVLSLQNILLMNIASGTAKPPFRENLKLQDS